jgi:hypothetical protein
VNGETCEVGLNGYLATFRPSGSESTNNGSISVSAELFTWGEGLVDEVKLLNIDDDVEVVETS